MLGLPAWVQRLSPYAHVSGLPGGPYSAGAAIVLLLVGSGLLLAGFAGFRDRDLTPG